MPVPRHRLTHGTRWKTGKLWKWRNSKCERKK
nr:MAG TPA: hypothetical protein [Caudoviricetes sp.]